MKEFIEKNPAVILVMMIVVGFGSFIFAGFNLHIMMGMADPTMKYVFITILTCVTGSIFTVTPITFLYDIIREKKREIYNLERRIHIRGTTTTRRREANHWDTDERQDDDDVDGDGEGDDSLRRLGVIR